MAGLLTFSLGLAQVWTTLHRLPPLVERRFGDVVMLTPRHWTAMSIGRGEFDEWQVIEHGHPHMGRRIEIAQGRNTQYTNLPMLLTHVRAELYGDDVTNDFPQSKQIRRTAGGLSFISHEPPIELTSGYRTQELTVVATLDKQTYWALRMSESIPIFETDEDAIDQATDLIAARFDRNREMFLEMVTSMRPAEAGKPSPTPDNPHPAP